MSLHEESARRPIAARSSVWAKSLSAKLGRWGVSPNAISVTYLIPIFAIAWGALFLDEAVTWPLVAGCAVVFLGTALATGILGARKARQPA